MLTSLHDGVLPVIHSSRFAWCSMKSIGYRSLCHKAAEWVVCHTSMRGTVLAPIGYDASSTVCQMALQAASCLITEKLKDGSCASFPYQTTQGQNIPLESSKTKIWANNPTNEKKWLILLSSQQSYLTCSSLLCSSETLKCFLHACTPERRTRACAHLFNQCEHGQTLQTKKHILQKNVQVPETLGNVASGGASKPHRSKYIASAQLYCPFYHVWRSSSWKAW